MNVYFPAAGKRHPLCTEVYELKRELCHGRRSGQNSLCVYCMMPYSPSGSLQTSTFSQSVCRKIVWDQRIRPGSLCRASAVCFICLCSLPCVENSINPFSYHVNRFILSKTNLPFGPPVARRHHRADSCTAGAFQAIACAACSSSLLDSPRLSFDKSDLFNIVIKSL